MAELWKNNITWLECILIWILFILSIVMLAQNERQKNIEKDISNISTNVEVIAEALWFDIIDIEKY